jgi:hypothetical protein
MQMFLAHPGPLKLSGIGNASLSATLRGKDREKF